MMTVESGRVGKVWLAGIAVAGAVMAFAPTASAEPAPGQNCDQQQTPPEGEPQQCDKGQGMPDLPDLPDNRGQQDGQQKQGIDLSDKNCWVVNGVPVMWAPGVSSRPGDVVSWCPTTYGLTPH